MKSCPANAASASLGGGLTSKTTLSPMTIHSLHLQVMCLVESLCFHGYFTIVQRGSWIKFKKFIASRCKFPNFTLG